MKLKDESVTVGEILGKIRIITFSDSIIPMLHNYQPKLNKTPTEHEIKKVVVINEITTAISYLKMNTDSVCFIRRGQNVYHEQRVARGLSCYAMMCVSAEYFEADVSAPMCLG